MSQINDALKRAKQAQKGPPPIPPRDAQYRPVGAPPARSSEFPVIIVIGFAVVLGLSVLIVTFRLIKRTEPQIVAAAAPEQSMTTFSARPPAPAITELPAPVVAKPVPPAAAVIAKPANPLLPKLQGIFFRTSNPSAILDGQTVVVGSHVGRFEVLAITQDTVVLGFAGQTNVLAVAE